jgi:ATP-binding cassette subfamily F protein 3
MLAGETAPLSGKRTPAADLSVGYFAQQQLEQLRPDCDAFWHLRNLGGADFAKGDEQRVRDHLGRFGFEGDRAFDPVGRFSGGEKARLTLSLLVARRPNLLLLDEPTNHLDIDMRHALTVALQSFEGGLVIVSHDRHLIKTVADTLWLVADGKLKVFDGDLDDYQVWLRSRSKGEPADTVRKAPGHASNAASNAASHAVSKSAPKANRNPASRSRGPLGSLRREIDTLEKRIAEMSARQSQVEAELCEDPMNTGLQAEHARLTREAAAAETQWMEVATAIESAEAEIGEPD